MTYRHLSQAHTLTHTHMHKAVTVRFFFPFFRVRDKHNFYRFVCVCVFSGSNINQYKYNNNKKGSLYSYVSYICRLSFFCVHACHLFLQAVHRYCSLFASYAVLHWSIKFLLLLWWEAINPSNDCARSIAMNIYQYHQTHPPLVPSTSSVIFCSRLPFLLCTEHCRPPILHDTPMLCKCTKQMATEYVQ